MQQPRTRLDTEHIIRQTTRDVNLLRYLRPDGEVQPGSIYVARYKYNNRRECFWYNLNTGEWGDDIAKKIGASITTLVADSLAIPDEYAHYYACIWLNSYLESDKDVERAHVPMYFPEGRYGPRHSSIKKIKGEKYLYDDEFGQSVAGDFLVVSDGYEEDSDVLYNLGIAYFVQTVYNFKVGKHVMHSVPWGRPLYNRGKVNRSENIMVFSDPKIAHFARSIWHDGTNSTGKEYTVAATTWSGGRGQVQRTDWSPIQGKNVLIIPRAQPAGEKHIPLKNQPDWCDATEIADILSQPNMENKAVRIVDPTNFSNEFLSPTIYTAMKYGCTKKQIDEYIRRNLISDWRMM